MTLEISSWDRFAAIRAENRTDIRLKENTTKIKILVYGLVFGLYFKRRQGGGGRNFWKCTVFDKYLVILGDSLVKELKSKRYVKLFFFFFPKMTAAHTAAEGAEGLKITPSCFMPHELEISIGLMAHRGRMHTYSLFNFAKLS